MNASLLIQDLFQSYPSFTKRISKVVFKELILVKAIASKCQHYYARSFKIYATVILIFFSISMGRLKLYQASQKVKSLNF